MHRAIARMAVPALAAGLTIMLASVLAPSPAQAAFAVCNKSNLAARVALGRFDGTNWTSQGWWTVTPKACATLLTGPLQARYYYLYASDGAAGTWAGKTHFCVAPSATFLAPGRADCARRGFESQGFFQVDTGNAANWTQTISN